MALALLVIGAPPALADGPGGGLFGAFTSTDGHEVDVTGVQHEVTPATDGRAGAAGVSTTRGHVPTPAELKALHAKLLDDICVSAGTCGTRGAGTLNPLIDVQPGQPAADGAPAEQVTLADLARYLPALGALHAEPDGWAVVRVPANFWVEVQPIVVQGQVLDAQADVRFTPFAYRWNYGDGSSRATQVAGASWADLGQQELTTTATSHRYGARGRLDASVTVYYAAAYRVEDGPWVDVAGAVAADSPALPLLVVTEHTVLTNG